MADLTFNITFIPPIGGYGTLIEYKAVSDSVWITPTSSPNPTTMSSYTLVVDDSTNYVVRLSGIGLNCTPQYTYVYVGLIPFGGFTGSNIYDCAPIVATFFFLSVGLYPVLGSLLWQDAACTVPYDEYIYIVDPAIPGTVYEVSGGEIIAITTCGP